MEKKRYIDEIWRPVVGYEGRYEVSNMGRVRSLDMITRSKHNSIRHARGRVLLEYVTRFGYASVMLAYNGIKKHYHVHRLVARAFPEICGKWFEGCQINHKDENKLNNCAWNLEVCDCKYNINYGTGIDRCAESRSKPIAQYTKIGEFVKEWKSVKDASEGMNITYTSLTNMLKGRSRTAGGFKWQYVSTSDRMQKGVVG